MTGLKKVGDLSVEARRSLINWEDSEFSVRRQCEFFGVSRSGLYYEPCGVSEKDLELMRLLDEEYTRHPFYERRMGGLFKRKQSQNQYGFEGTCPG